MQTSIIIIIQSRVYMCARELLCIMWMRENYTEVSNPFVKPSMRQAVKHFYIFFP